MRFPSRAASRLLVSVVLAVVASALPADTPVSGTVSASTTWALSGSPFIVTGDVLVEGPGVPVLTIEAGVAVRFNSGKRLAIGKNAPGKLLAAGTASRPLSFSANSASPTAGYWQGIFFYAQAASGSKVAEATVEYAGFDGGWDGAWGGVSVNGSSPTVQNLTVRSCAVAGITIGAGSPVITGAKLIGNPVGLSVSYPATPSLQTTTVSNSAGFAMSMDPRVTFSALSGLSFSGNGTNAIEVRGARVDVNTTWRNGGVPYIVGIPLWVEGSSKPVLTIKPGAALKFNPGTFIWIGNSLGGGLAAVGTASERILFSPNSSSPWPGFWQGIIFGSAALSTSKIAYASISYGGSGDSVNGYKGGITLTNASPTLQNVSVQNSLIAGIRVIGGSPAISGSTISGNPVGISFGSPGAPSLQTSTLSGNTGFAISMDAQVSFTSLSGLSVSGNGTDAIEVRNGGIGVNTTWKNGGVPYVVNTTIRVEGAAKPVFTIEPGATLKFKAGMALYVGDYAEGGISAVGTDLQRITFTTSSPNPAPSTYAGLWGGILLRSGTLPGSTIAYASVAYAGLADGVNGYKGGIHVVSSSPVLDHVRFETNTYAGLSVSLGSPTITNCDFKAAGLINQSAAQPIAALLNWWGSESGPGGSGPGNGQPVSGGVRFEPWLTAPASTPQFVNAFTVKNSTFNPSIGINATLAFAGAKSAGWKATFSAGGNAVRSITATGANVTLVWDGNDSAGAVLPGGAYTYKIETTSGAAASPVFGRVAIDRTRQLAVSGFALAPPFFSPNGDDVQDTTTLTGSASFDGAVWSVKVKNAGGTIVRTVTGAADPAISFTWDGKNGSSTVQPDGVYTLELTVTDGGQAATTTGTATADRTLPVAAISSPAAGAVLSNVYQNGGTDVDVTGTGTDANFKSWLLEYGSGSAPASWAQISSGTLPISSAKLATWPTAPRPVGIYTLRLHVVDLAGNTAVFTRTMTVGNFGVSMNVTQFNGSAGGSVTYTSVIPFALSETITIKNAAGQTVRTLFSGSRAAGTFTDVWNGRDAQASLLPDGPYFYTASAAAGSSSMVWDLGGVYSTLPNSFFCQAWVPVTNFQPFNNRFLPLSYNLSIPARTWVLFSVGWYDCNTPGPPLAACADPDKFCLPNGEYQESGLHSGWWAGVDPAGAFRGNIGSVAVLARQDNFSRNAVVLFGSKPGLTNLVVQPTAFNPGFGPQSVAFDVSSFQNQPLNVSVSAKNQESLSVLRTVTAAAQPAGHVAVLWDGRADNGMWAAPGAYTLTVTVSDAIGNAVSRQALTSISY